ncbi:MAG: hypothetical protein HYX93_02080 [Chloroflexi bacterium]|nr:hypothetical protein [Chloroflexota bacterium]
MGGQPAPDGLLIYAKVRWYSSKTVKTFGGKYQGLIVAPNDWALDRETITFHLDGVQANETAIYSGSVYDFKTLNLTFPALPGG